MERRLAAILAADVVGYSRLIRKDETGTLAALKDILEQLIEPKVAERNGRIVKLMGDGLLAEFPSAVEAVQCAVEIQHWVGTRTAEERRVVYRIGINIGDIVVEGDDIYGDGVNVAARLEGLAEPGGICVARNVFDQVKDKLDFGFEDLGEQSVKNIDEPVAVYRVLFDGQSPGMRPKPTHRGLTPVQLVVAAVVVVLIAASGASVIWQPWAPDVEPASMERMAFPLPDKPSIAVLPFTNMSDNPGQEYFADGMTEDLITDLSKVSGLFVIARNSSFGYKGKSPKVRQVAEDLGVRYVLEGSVRRVGDEVRINAQLIDATTGGHLWAERYDGSLADIFALQDKVLREIVGALALNLTENEELVVAGVETRSQIHAGGECQGGTASS
jgi:TolB-like protein/class 3 adenylate cyclase